MSYQGKVYRKQGGDELVVASGGKITVESGGELAVGAGATLSVDPASTIDFQGSMADFVGDVEFVVGSETGGDTINVAVQLKDPEGTALAKRASLLMYLSDDEHGDSLTASAPSGGWAIGADGLLIPVVAGKAAYFVSESDGDIDIDIVEAGAATWYLIAVFPNGQLVASEAITFAGA